MNHLRAPLRQGESYVSIQNIPTRPARDDADPATGRYLRVPRAVRATVVHGWDVRPTLDRANATGRSLAQAAGSLVEGSPLPQVLIRCRQRLTDELRLGTLVILSRSAPQPAADDSAVAQPTTTSSPGSSCAPERTGDMPPRHIPRLTSLRAHHCVPSSVHVRPCLTEPYPPTSSGSAFPIKTGSESQIAIRGPQQGYLQHCWGRDDPPLRRAAQGGSVLPLLQISGFE